MWKEFSTDGWGKTAAQRRIAIQDTIGDSSDSNRLLLRWRPYCDKRLRLATAAGLDLASYCKCLLLKGGSRQNTDPIQRSPIGTKSQASPL